VSLGASENPHFVLVTGSTGFLGSKTVETLINKGYHVRALARKTSKTEYLKKLNVEICYGDVADYESLERAFENMNCVVHAAADTKNDSMQSLKTTMRGAQNVISLSKKYGINKLVYISSCSVYGVSDLRKDQIVDENAPLERYPEKRGFYSEAKLKAEQLVLETSRTENVPVVCLRPGTIYGPGGKVYTPIMGFSMGNRFFVNIGNGTSVLPLVYIDNVVEAIMLALANDKSTGQIYNVVDPERITKKEYTELLLKRLYPNATFCYFPYSLLYVFVFLQETLTRLLGRKPFLTRYRLISSQRNIIYDSTKIKKELNWNPPISLQEALDQILTYESRKTHLTP